MTYQTPWYDKKRDPGAYAHLRINELVGSLPSPELHEYQQLQEIKRKKRTEEQQDRMEDLYGTASEIYNTPGGRGWQRQQWARERAEAESQGRAWPVDPWYDELARRMWNRLTEEEKADWTARNPAAARRYLSPVG